jgi:hypothetical protein
MRPHEGSKADGRARARALIASGLGWLHGYPVSAARWARVSRLGGAAKHETETLTRAHLSKAERTLRTLRREHLRALSAEVGDVERWEKSTRTVLGFVKRAVHHGERMPSAEAALAAIVAPRLAARFAETRRTCPTGARRILDALGWLHAREPARLANTLAWFDGDAVARVCQSLEDAADLVITLDAIVQEDGFARVQPLWRALSDPLALSVRPSDDAARASHLAEVVAARGKGKLRKLNWPRDSKSEPLSPMLARLVVWLSQQHRRQRRQGLALVGRYVPLEGLPRWKRWHDARLALMERAEIAHRRQPLRTPPEVDLLPGLAKRLERLAARKPPTISAEGLLRVLQREATQDAKRHRLLLRALDALPVRGVGQLLRMELGILWSQYADGYPEEASVSAAMLRESARYFRRHRQRIAHAIAPWRPTLTRHNFWIAPEALLRREDAAFDLPTLLFAAFDRLLDDADTTKWCPSVSLRTLVQLLRLCRDATTALGRLAAIDQAGINVARQYIDSDVLETAHALAAAPPERFGRLVAVLDAADEDEGVDLENVFGLCAQARDDRVAQVLADSAFAGDSKRVSLLGVRAKAAKHLGVKPIVLKVPEAPADGAARWLRGYPAKLHGPLRALAAVAPDAEDIAERLLGKRYPSHAHLKTQLRAIDERLASTSGVAKKRLAKRRTNLRARLDAKPTAPSPRQLAKETERIEQARRRALLTRWEQQLDASVQRAVTKQLGADLPAWLTEQPSLRLLPAICSLDAHSRRVGFRVLRARAGAYPHDLRDAPANRAFLAKLVGFGIDPRPWLDGIGIVEHRTDKGPVYLQLERDPLEVMMMGAHFETCLTPGYFNFFSAVANAADINKRVLYARNRDGEVVGRCLFAVTDSGGLLAFHTYCHDGSLGFGEMAADFLVRLAKRMGSTPVPRGDVSCLVSKRWYDDGPIDLTGRLAALEPGSDTYQLLETLPPEHALAALEGALAHDALHAAMLPIVVNLPVFDQRPELVLPLLGRVAEAPLPPMDKARTAHLAHRAGESEAARRVLHDGVARACLRSVARGTTLPHDVVHSMVELGFSSTVLKMLKRARPRGVRRWADERRAHHVLLAAHAYRALHRVAQARRLYAQLDRKGVDSKIRATARRHLEQLP